MKREDAVADVVDALQDVGRYLELLVVADESRVAVDDHHADVAILRHQHPQIAAVASRRPVGPLDAHDQRRMRNPLRERRELAGGNIGFEHRRLFGARAGREQQREREEQRLARVTANHASSAVVIRDTS